MGIVINKLASEVNFRDLLVQLDIVEARNEPDLPGGVDNVRVHRGGPVETGRGFVLHSADFFIENATLADRRRRLPDRDAGDPARHRATGAGPTARCSRSAMPAGRPDSWSSRSRRTAGCTARPTEASCSTPTSTPNTTARSPRSGVSRRCCQRMPATPEGGRSPPHLLPNEVEEGELRRAPRLAGAGNRGVGRRRTICCTICGVIGRP